MHDFSTPASVVLAIGGSVLFYLAAPGQRWLRAPLAPRLCRVLSAALVCGAFVVGVGGIGMQGPNPATSIAVVVTAVMACLTACPFIGVMVVRVKARSELLPTQSQSSGAAR